MDVHEKLRLLYVACTRARDHLVVAVHHQTRTTGPTPAPCGRRPRPSPTPWRRLPAEDEDEPAAAARRRARSRRLCRRTTTGTAWLAAREALLAPQRRPAVRLGHHHRPGGRRRRGRRASATPTTPPAPAGVTGDGDVPVTPRRRGRAGTAIGRAVHATLQFVDLAAPAGRRRAGRPPGRPRGGAGARRHDRRHGPLRPGLRRRPAGGRSRASHKELYVAAPVGDRVIEGYVDLLVETPDGLVIVDYKTDTVGLRRRGRRQARRLRAAGRGLRGGTRGVDRDAGGGVPLRVLPPIRSDRTSRGRPRCRQRAGATASRNNLLGTGETEKQLRSASPSSPSGLAEPAAEGNDGVGR